MRKLVLFMHTSLDGFVAGPKGESFVWTSNFRNDGGLLANGS